MNEFQNLTFLSNEKNLMQFLDGLQLPQYAKVALLEKALARENNLYMQKVQDEGEKLSKLQEKKKEEEEQNQPKAIEES